MNSVAVQSNTQVLEKVILGNDLSSLSSIEKVQYVKNICDSIGLNPITRPIQLIKFQGKEIPYFTKDSTEQLRKINKISISIKDTKIIDDLYLVTAEATTADGRTDSSTGAITISGLKGDAKANALMKCETKAKRRVTLSICGLGFMDESEVDSMPGAVKLSVNEPIKEIEAQDNNNMEWMLEKIYSASNIAELQTMFSEYSKFWQKKKDVKNLKAIMEAKDARKKELEVIEFNQEIEEAEETGEIHE
jgi:hypothetical protein